MRKIYTATALALACAAALALNAACKSGDRAGAERASPASAPASSAPQATSSPQAATSTPQTTNGATPHPTSTPGDGVRRITVADARKAADGGEAVIVDVRPKTQYDQGHIRGSLSIPKNELPNRLGELPKDKLIIFYCA